MRFSPRVDRVFCLHERGGCGALLLDVFSGKWRRAEGVKEVRVERDASGHATLGVYSCGSCQNETCVILETGEIA